jgi:hypothetical protein
MTLKLDHREKEILRLIAENEQLRIESARKDAAIKELFADLKIWKDENKRLKRDQDTRS